MVVTERPITPAVREELLKPDPRWNDAGLTLEDLAKWLPGFLPGVGELDEPEFIAFAPGD
jgi:hypothetical protein